MSFDRIPPELRALPHWVAFNLVKRGEKWTKLPVNCHTGNLASSTAPKTWTTFEKAVDFAKRMKLAGIGFVFTKEAGFVGIDMDGHVDQELVEWFGSYAERSQSGKGVHIICRGSVPEGRKNDRYEIYGDGRYFVMTGDVIHDKPIAECQAQIDAFLASEFPPRAAVQPDQWAHAPAASGPVDLSGFMGGVCNRALPDAEQQDPVTMAKASAQGAKFTNLWNGHWQMEGYESQSSADAALLSMLRFWTGGHQVESFALFRQSGLMRPKFDRQDYRERTWRSIDSGEVFEARRADYVIGKPTAAVAMPVTTKTISEAASPWRKTTVTNVLQAIDGTLFARIVDAMRSPMDPPLPPEVGIVKAVALMGCALSGKREKPRGQGNLVAHTAQAAELARVRIMTAGGQVPNMMALLVAKSASGKDVGGLLERVANAYGWMIGTAGSEEGIADAYMTKPNGMLAISEFANWLDKDHWQSKAASFLTTAFNKGWFAHSMSKRSQGAAREANYCYPNVYANIQPGILQKKASAEDVDSGFLGRFLMAQMPADYWGEGVKHDLAPVVEECRNCLAPFVALDADIQIPDGYTKPLARMFMEAKATPEATWKRLVNEYYPRLALMMAGLPGQPIPTTIPDHAWARADTLVRYFFAQAEAILTDIHDDPETGKRERLQNKLVAYVAKAGAAGASLADISRANGRGTTAEERGKALNEMCQQGKLTMQRVDGIATYFAGAA